MNEWSEFDRQQMQHALGLAALGMNTTDPNPRVGCVLTHGQQVVGEGWHERAGEAHAEVRALQSAGAAAAGATAYVTLEPCAGQGRTPPCTTALIEAGVRRVVYAAADPSPAMSGGSELLRAAGIEVAGGLLAEESRELNPGFFKRIASGLPWVRVKLGVSFDGHSALANGASRWITGKVARKDGQLNRARSSVVLTGVGTIVADDPALNVRLEGVTRQPLRVVLDSQLRSPPGSRVFDREGAALVIGVNADAARRAALEAARVQVDILPAGSDGRVDLVAALRRLAQLGANEVWVEAGATLAGAFMAAGLVDELVIYMAPSLLGDGARPMLQLPMLQTLEQRTHLRFVAHDLIGDDLRIIARPCLPVSSGT